MKNKPNVIFIFSDDLGYGDISAFNNQSKINTKNIDSLAKQGMMFTNSHACSALCTPSRYGLLTGRYSFRSKLKFLVLSGDSMPLIEKGRKTLGDLFKENGYATACVGKWHLGLEWQLNNNPVYTDFNSKPEIYDDIPARDGDEPSLAFSCPESARGLDIDYSKPIKYGPNEYGFDYFYGMPASLDTPPYVYIENHSVIEQPTYLTGEQRMDRRSADIYKQWEFGPSAPSFDHSRVLDDMNDKVLELIDKYSTDNKPFFIYYPTPAVHAPLLPNNKFKGKSGLNSYGDIVLQLDDMVGSIIERLKINKIEDNTIIVFTSDNGCSKVANIDELLSKGHNPSAIYRGYKFSLYEGGHRVPTIVRYPGKVKAGTICNENICHTDFFATFASLLGEKLSNDEAEDSFDNLPLWFETGKCERKSTVYSCSSGYLSIYKDKWKLLCCENGGDTKELNYSAKFNQPVSQNFELYDICNDPSEKENLVNKEKKVVNNLEKELTQIFDNGRSNTGVKVKNFEPKQWVQINWKNK